METVIVNSIQSISNYTVIDQLPLMRNNVTPTFGSWFFGDKMHWCQWERMQNIELVLT